MKKHLIVWLVALGMVAGYAAIAAKPGPKDVTIKACQKTKPPVAFPHEAHAKKQKIACKTCHHKEAGKACIYITHNISEVHKVSDRFVLIDRGEIVGHYRKDELSLEQLIEKMTHVVQTATGQ